MSDDEGRRRAYVESTIIMTVVRVVSPFVLTFGLFIMFHGADTPGGGFQGGAVVGSVILMLAFAFGADPVRRWLDVRVIVALLAGGLTTFVAVGLGTMALGGNFLQYGLYDPLFGAKVRKYGIELVELGIGATVAGVITGLFFLIDAGMGLLHADEEGES